MADSKRGRRVEQDRDRRSKCLSAKKDEAGGRALSCKASLSASPDRDARQESGPLPFQSYLPRLPGLHGQVLAVVQTASL